MNKIRISPSIGYNANSIFYLQIIDTINHNTTNWLVFVPEPEDYSLLRYTLQSVETKLVEII